jgi:PAS domain S-box-containing protein
MRTKSDGFRWFLARGVAARVEAEKLTRMAGSIQDITNRRQTEEALRASEQRFALFMKHLPGVAFINDPEGRVLFANETYERVVGRKSKELTGCKNDEIFSSEVATRFAEQDHTVRTQGRTLVFDEVVPDTTGPRDWLTSKFPIYREAQPTLVGGMAVDITDRKRVEASLRESEESLRAIFEQAAVGVAQIETSTGRFIRVNQKYCDIVGISDEKMTATTFMAITHPDDLQVDLDNVERLKAGEIREFSMEKRYLRPDGSVVWVDLTVSPMWKIGKEPKQHIAVVEDIGERKDAEAEREKLEVLLRHAQKMQAVGQLAGGVAHDFNNVLTAILGNVELLLPIMERGVEEGSMDVGKSRLEEIKAAGQRAAALTRQLLTFARKDMVKAEVLDLGLVVRGSQEMLRRLLREDIVLDVNTVAGTHCIRADAGQIEQVMMNLVLNARDAMPDGGTLTLTCADADLDDANASVHMDAGPGPHVMFAVSDTGVGMSKETTEHLFEPFFTTKPTGKGTGLGLATVYGILKQTGACILVESELGRGSTFKVYFPAIEEEPAKPEVAASVDALRGDEVILVCEDDELVRRLACQVLRTAGYTVLEAENGKHALAVVASCGGPIHLLVSDVVMPEMDGRRLAEEMGRSRPGIRVVFVSGYTDEVLDGEVLRGEGKDFLQKPFSPEDLLKRVRGLLDQP